MYKVVAIYLILALHSSLIDAEVVIWSPCDDTPDSLCEIKEVRINPCKEAKSGSDKPCRFKSGTNISIEFDFIPKFESEKLMHQAYWTSFVDLPLPGMQRNGCLSTACPVKPGEQAVYKNSIFMAPAFPLLNYDVKWRLWDSKVDSNGCCFIFKIKLVK